MQASENLSPVDYGHGDAYLLII